jgi:DNA primase
LPRFSQLFIDQVAQATDIVDLVSTYIALKRRGGEFVGLCPFHDDKNPSLNVSPAKQIYKCFVCGAGGGVFQWVMNFDKASFPEAVESLAQRANIPLPAEQGPGPQGSQGPSRACLQEICQFAQRFFQAQLKGPAGKQAMDYALARGFTREAIEQFALGFAPDSWDALLQAAGRKGHAPAQIAQAGLGVQRESGGHYDRFRNRLMIPIRDPSGKTIAFGGRALDDNERAKYLNSAESPIFDKSRNLFGLDLAREQIVQTGTAVVAEGYFDVLLPHQHGAGNLVATLGTSLTDGHVRILSRYAKEVVLLFDADDAGANAALRALELFLQQQVDVRIACIPDGKDPADFVLAHGAQALEDLVSRAPDALKHVWQLRSRAIQQGSSLVERRREVDEFLRLVATSEAYGSIDEVRRGQLAHHIAHLLNIPVGDLQMQMRRLTRRLDRRPQAGQGVGLCPQPGPQGPGDLAQRQIIEVLLNDPDQFDSVAERLDPSDFTSETLIRIARAIWALAAEGKLSLEELICREQWADLAPQAVALAEAGRHRGNYERTLAGAIECVLYRRGQEEIEEMKSSACGDDEMLRRLHSRLRRADLRKRPRIL